MMGISGISTPVGDQVGWKNPKRLAVPVVLPRFAGSPTDKVSAYERWLMSHMAKLQPQDRFESLNLLKKIRQEAAEPSKGIVTKQSAQDVWFSVRNATGLVDRNDPMVSHEKPQGLFFQDMQHLDHFMIYGPNRAPLELKSLQKNNRDADCDVGFVAAYQVQDNPDLQIRRTHRITEEAAMVEQMLFTNTGKQPVTFVVELGTMGKDIFQARSAQDASLATDIHYRARQDAQKGTITIAAQHQRKDDPHGEIQPKSIVTWFRPSHADANWGMKDTHTAQMLVTVQPGESELRQITIGVSNEEMGTALQPTSRQKESMYSTVSRMNVQAEPQMQHLPKVWETAFKDLLSLSLPVHCGESYFTPPAAGIPNFVALFGRDSLITSMQALQFNPLMARETLASLAYYQGTKHDAFTEEEPGKILHELRRGETTRLGLSPHRPYYGTIDATPLFVILFGEYLKRTRDSSVGRVLWPNVEAALACIDQQLITDPHNPLFGFLAQRDTAIDSQVGGKGLKNIGWKDSDAATRHVLRDQNGKIYEPGPDGQVRDSQDQVLMDADGRLTEQGHALKLRLDYAQYPLALAEVQAYVYGAWRTAENLYRLKAKGNQQSDADKTLLLETSRAYGERADALKRRFNEKFWMPDQQFVAMALQADGRPLRSLASNGAQSLLTGIVDDDKAAAMAKRLVQPDLLSGWGLRTLSSQSPAYDPFAYHNGTIWPHDNALVVMGLARYGLKEAANTVASQVFRAASRFEEARLPELYSGLPPEGPDDPHIPVYPNTCLPQAWASATPPAMLASLLGLRVESARSQITLTNPVLPDGVNAMRLTLSVTPDGDAKTVEPEKVETIQDLETFFRRRYTATAPGEKVTLLLSRDGAGQVQVKKLNGAPQVKVAIQRTPQPGNPPESAAS